VLLDCLYLLHTGALLTTIMLEYLGSAQNNTVFYLQLRCCDVSWYFLVQDELRQCFMRITLWSVVVCSSHETSEVLKSQIGNIILWVLCWGFLKL
jgi:hypothetical protein